MEPSEIAQCWGKVAREIICGELAAIIQGLLEEPTLGFREGKGENAHPNKIRKLTNNGWDRSTKRVRSNVAKGRVRWERERALERRRTHKAVSSTKVPISLGIDPLKLLFPRRLQHSFIKQTLLKEGVKDEMSTE